MSELDGPCGSLLVASRTLISASESAWLFAQRRSDEVDMAAGGGPRGERSWAGRAGGAAATEGGSPHLRVREGLQNQARGLQPPALAAGRGPCHSQRGTACVTLALSSSIMPSTFLPMAEPAGGHGPFGAHPANTS